MQKAILGVVAAWACIPVATAQEKPTTEQIVRCASLHGWLFENSDVSPADRELARNEALWFAERAVAMSPGDREAIFARYKEHVASRKMKAAEAAFDPDPDAEAVMMQNARAEIGSCSQIGAAIQPR